MNIDQIASAARDLVAAARASGLHLTIETKPLQPLAMGHVEMAVDVRPARHADHSADVNKKMQPVHHPATSAKVLLQAPVVAWHCAWADSGWTQYHDAEDPLPAKWDDAPTQITPLIRQSDHQRIVTDLKLQLARSEQLAADRLDLLKDNRRAYLDARDRLRQDERDAHRYRWLRDVGNANWRPLGLRHGHSAAQADQKVDNAMAATDHLGDANKMVEPGAAMNGGGNG